MSTAALVLLWYLAILLNIIVWADDLGPWLEKRCPFLVTIWNAIRDTIHRAVRAVARALKRVRH